MTLYANFQQFLQNGVPHEDPLNIGYKCCGADMFTICFLNGMQCVSLMQLLGADKSSIVYFALFHDLLKSCNTYVIKRGPLSATSVHRNAMRLGL